MSKVKSTDLIVGTKTMDSNGAVVNYITNIALAGYENHSPHVALNCLSRLTDLINLYVKITSKKSHTSADFRPLDQDGNPIGRGTSFLISDTKDYILIEMSSNKNKRGTHNFKVTYGSVDKFPERQYHEGDSKLSDQALKYFNTLLSQITLELFNLDYDIDDRESEVDCGGILVSRRFKTGIGVLISDKGCSNFSTHKALQCIYSLSKFNRRIQGLFEARTTVAAKVGNNIALLDKKDHDTKPVIRITTYRNDKSSVEVYANTYNVPEFVRSAIEAIKDESNLVSVRTTKSTYNQFLAEFIISLLTPELNKFIS